jgi:hypothetical protein
LGLESSNDSIELFVELAHVSKLSESLGVATISKKITLSHRVLSVQNFEPIFTFLQFFFVIGEKHELIPDYSDGLVGFHLYFNAKKL